MLQRSKNTLHCWSDADYQRIIRLDPVQIRVALPAADPPDNPADIHPSRKWLGSSCAVSRSPGPCS